jgi:hypothetical protein
VIQAKVSGVPLFDCHYGTSNGRYSLRVDELLTGPSAGWLGAAQAGLSSAAAARRPSRRGDGN